MAPSPARASQAPPAAEITAVSSTASKDYVRAKNPDGTYKEETYAFGNGGRMNGPMPDSTIDKLDFMTIARTVALPLASQNYMPSRDPKQTKLLVMLYWGTTTGTSSATASLEHERLQQSQVSTISPAAPPTGPSSIGVAGASAGVAAQENAIQKQVNIEDFNSILANVAMEDKERAKTDAQNAMLLGYDSELAATDGLQNSVLRHAREDLLSEVEDSRYFIVLMAYDFQVAWKEKQHKLLWVTRISVRQKNNDFGKILPAMTRYASQFFGQDTGGLVRKPLPEGRVEVGEPRSLGEVPEK